MSENSVPMARDGDIVMCITASGDATLCEIGQPGGLRETCRAFPWRRRPHSGSFERSRASEKRLALSSEPQI